MVKFDKVLNVKGFEFFSDRRQEVFILGTLVGTDYNVAYMITGHDCGIRLSYPGFFEVDGKPFSEYLAELNKESDT